ncbi:MAG TPA: glycosyltransferase family 1 protein [Aggregatilineales bacterium]|nr:glycosyltransferase family 4 protein [Anaerolineales bacterium]HRE46401.1 glycosyltransferase family 1 protein [Aggregatilineales bacterium]
MHIAFNAWFWNQPYSGSGQYLRALVAALRRFHPALRLSLVLPGERSADVPTEVNTVALKIGRGQLGKVLFEQRAYPAAVRRLRADIAHVPYWGAPLSSPARLIVTVHDVIPLSLPVYRGGLSGSFYFSLVRASAKGAGHILTDSTFSKSEIMAYIGVPAEQITAIPLAAGEMFHPKLGAERDEAIRVKYTLPKEGYALYLGGYDIRKNVRALIAGYTFVGPSAGDQYPLILAGSPPTQWGSARFPDLPAEIAARPGLDQWVRWIGAVAEEDKPAVYRMARVFVFPSRYEGFGLPPLEAMASGTPVVAANASSIPEVVGESAYLVDPDDARKMGGAIIAVMIQDDLHASLRAAGLARATAFSWERTARETVAVYEDVMRR